MIFEGSGVALVTPFNDNNEVDFFSLKKLIEFQIANGTKAIIILGTTGESSTISMKEREKIIKFCVFVVGKLVPVIVGCGSNSTETAKQLTFQAKRLGADAALIVTPYYNKCNQNGLIFHYKEIASFAKFPIILYNVPSRTGVNLLPETVLKLSQNKYIVGIKEASSDFAQITKLLHILPPNFAVYSGDDSLTFSMMTLGAKGVISVTANAYPAMVQALCEFARIEDYQNARRIANKLFEINKALFLDVNPICIKKYLNLMGFQVGVPRLPLTEAGTDITNKLKKVMEIYEH